MVNTAGLRLWSFPLVSLVVTLNPPLPCLVSNKVHTPGRKSPAVHLSVTLTAGHCWDGKPLMRPCLTSKGASAPTVEGCAQNADISDKLGINAGWP